MSSCEDIQMDIPILVTLAGLEAKLAGISSGLAETERKDRMISKQDASRQISEVTWDMRAFARALEQELKKPQEQGSKEPRVA